MTTLSKLKQEGREEFDKYDTPEMELLQKLLEDFDEHYYGGCEDSQCCFTADTMVETVRKWKEALLAKQAKEAYLTALSDVEKGLPKEVDLKDRFWGKSEVEYGFEHTHNNVLSAVKEVVKSLREKK